MTKHAISKRVSREIHSEAMKIARSRQVPGQTKEQTRLIAQGIQRGIEQYLRAQAERTRELDRKLKRIDADAPNAQESSADAPQPGRIPYRLHWLPWLLLILTWLGIGAYWLLRPLGA
jgi:hypothetical protein